MRSIPQTLDSRFLRFLEIRFPYASTDYRADWIRTYRKGLQAVYNRADTLSLQVLLECKVLDIDTIDAWHKDTE